MAAHHDKQGHEPSTARQPEVAACARPRLRLIKAALGVAALAAIVVGLLDTRFGRPAAGGPVPGAQAASCPATGVRLTALDRASAVKEIAKTPAYTQGLILADGQLYESTGQKGHSAIYRLDADAGRRSELFRLDDNLFGEGLARIGDRLYQLTWRAGLAFAYTFDPSGSRLDRVATYRRTGEGWGLTDLADQLVLSDGSDVLSFIDPATFDTRRALPVRFGDRPVRNLNELEFARGAILANIYGDTRIVGIDPESGCVQAVIDATGLIEDMIDDLLAVPDPVCAGGCEPWDFVLNGIAYDPETDELYLTGKNWPIILVYRGILG